MATRKKTRTKPKRRSRTWLWTTLILLAMAAVGVGLYLILGHSSLKDDGVFLGELQDGNPHGPGVMILKDGAIVAGTWDQGLRDGVMRTVGADPEFSVWRRGIEVSSLKLTGSDYRYGIDVSRYQPEYWGAMLIAADSEGFPMRGNSARPSGYLPVSFVIIKASGLAPDPRYRYHSEMAEKLSIPQGAYHVYGMTANIVDQANMFLSQIEDRHLSFPPILDVEGSTAEVPRSVYEEMEPRIVQWLWYVWGSTGVRPVIYCCRDFYNAYGHQPLLQDFDFWIADYSSNPTPDHWKMRQISDQGRIVGWESNVDIDILYMPFNEEQATDPALSFQ